MIKNTGLTLLLCLTLLGSACSKESTDSSQTQTTEKPAFKSNPQKYLALMPEQCVIIFYANMAKMQGKPLGKEFRLRFEESEVKDNNAYQAFIEGTGVKPEKDLYEIWMGVLPHADDDKKQGGIIATGKFDKKRVTKYLLENPRYDIEEVEYNGRKVYVSRKSRSITELAFLSDRAFVAGDHEWVKAVLDQAKDPKASILDNPAMRQQIDEIGLDTDIWGIVDLEVQTTKWINKLAQTPFMGTSSIDKIRLLTFHSMVENEVDMQIKALFDSENEAQLLAETLIGFKAMAKLMMADDREAIDMLDQIKIRSQKDRLIVAARLDEAFFNKALEKSQTLSNPAKL